MFNFLIFCCFLTNFSPIFVGADQDLPQQVHLSVDEKLDPTITWNTMLTKTYSICRYSTSESLQSFAEQAGYQTKFVDPGKAKRTQYIHRVHIAGLSEATIYYYQCGDGTNWSPTYSFRTLRKDSNWAPKFAVYGDMGLENAQSVPRLTREVDQGHFDMILHVGDVAYDMYERDGQQGDDYMNLVQPYAAKIPYMTCPGNHENKYNFTHYKHRFSMPGSEAGMFYSFNIGPAHIIAFSTEFYYYVQYGIKQIWHQYHWLLKDLEEASKPENRAKHPWIITMGHRPMYCANQDNDDCTHYYRDLVRRGYGWPLPWIKIFGLEDMFYKYGVDLQFYAHEHSYERMWPLYDLKVYNGSVAQPYVNPKAPVHVVTGSAGCRERIDNFNPNPPAWSAFRHSDYGYTHMEIFNSTHLHLQQVSDDQGGTVVDEIWIVKDQHGPYNANFELKKTPSLEEFLQFGMPIANKQPINENLP